MKLCIAEKPSVAGEIAHIIGAKQRREGFYEGNDYCVTWTFGHLCSLKEPHDYLPEWKRWNLGSLPLIPSRFGIKLIADKGIEKQFNVIRSLVAKADEVINCGDAGQEGELIQRWVLQKAGMTCPMKRLWISSLTEEAIREGFQKLHDGKEFENLYAAGSSRAIGDWLLGINATRLYTIKYGQQKQVLSIGRVQTPTLALIVQRQKEIDNFIAEPYWELKTRYRGVVFSATKGRFSSVDEGQKALSSIEGSLFEITDFTKKEGKESAPRLFDLTSLQVECNRKYAFSAEETLNTIQSLYEKKLTTYPRVDTTYLSDDIYPKIEATLRGLTPYKQFTEPLLKEKIKKSKKVFDNSKVTDHHAIIPTGMEPPSSLSRNEKLVFDLVTRRFIANFYPDSTVSTTTVLGVAAEIDFKASGKQILHPGWRILYQTAQQKRNEEEKEEGEQEEGDDAIMPSFEKGEKGQHEPQLAERQTQPPKPYTEATLLRAMETAGKQVDDEELRDFLKENGIGRPSTRANIIETLFRRKYIVKEKKNLKATITGVQLIDSIRNELLKSAELTGLWEKKLRLIEKGQYEVGAFMQELRQMVTDMVHTIKNDYSGMRIEIIQEDEDVKKESPVAKPDNPQAEPSIVCPRCGKGVMKKGHSAWGCSAYKDGCQTVIPFEFCGKKLTDAQIKQLLKNGKTGVIKGFIIEGVKMDGSVLLDDNYHLVLQQSEKKEWRCPSCKQGIIVKGKSAYGCTNFKNNCRLRIPFEFMGKVLTENQVEALILNGETAPVKALVLPSGDKLNGRIFFDDQFQLGVKQ